MSNEFFLFQFNNAFWLMAVHVFVGVIIGHVVEKKKMLPAEKYSSLMMGLTMAPFLCFVFLINPFLIAMLFSGTAFALQSNIVSPELQALIKDNFWTFQFRTSFVFMQNATFVILIFTPIIVKLWKKLTPITVGKQTT